MRPPAVRYLGFKQSYQDLELELLRRVVHKLEALSNATPRSKDMSERGSSNRDEVAEMYRLLLLLEVTKQLQYTPAQEVRGVDWARLLPLLLAVGVVLGVILAELLGLDMRRIL